MELRDLKAFMAVVEHRSFTKAAHDSFVSQPSLSKSIKKLEESLQVELLNRSTRNVELTDAGSIVYHQGQKIMQAVQELHILLDDLLNIKTGAIKLGIPPLIGTLFLTMSCFVLQKTIRDNEEDNERFPKNKPLDKE